MMEPDEAVLETCRQFLLAVANAEFPESLRAKAGASDLVQETLADAHQNREQFRGQTRADLRAWLRGILLNRIAMFHRRYAGTAARDARREVPLELAESFEMRVPENALVRKEENHAILIAVQDLPAEYREAVRLRLDEELGFASIGERLGRTEEAARKLFTRAIDRLRGRLASTSD
jgi:RNA polymerase sigma-70 factor (subfamily 1)